MNKTECKFKLFTSKNDFGRMSKNGKIRFKNCLKSTQNTGTFFLKIQCPYRKKAMCSSIRIKMLTDFFIFKNDIKIM